MPQRKRTAVLIRILLVASVMLAVASSGGIAQDSTKVDTAAVKRDTVHVLPEVHRLRLPAHEERTMVLGTGLVILGGFLVLMILKKREADKSRRS